VLGGKYGVLLDDLAAKESSTVVALVKQSSAPQVVVENLKSPQPDKRDEPSNYVVGSPEFPDIFYTREGLVRMTLDQAKSCGYVIATRGDVMDNVCDHGYGWGRVIPGKGTTIILDSFVEKLTIPAYESLSIMYHQRDYNVFMPAIAEVRDLTTGVVKDHTKAALLAKISKVFNTSLAILPLELQLSTADYLNDRTHYLWSQGTQSHTEVRKTGNLSSVGTLDPVLTRALAQLGIKSTEGIPKRVEAQTCELPNDYKLRYDVSVVSSDANNYHLRCNATLVTTTMEHHIIRRRPQFIGDIKPVKEYRTMYTRFMGDNVEPFIEYANNAQNFSLALKRMLSARVGEFHYRNNSRELVRELVHACRVQLQGLIATNIEYGFMRWYSKDEKRFRDIMAEDLFRNQIDRSVFEEPFKDDERTETHRAVAPLLAKYIARCCKSTVDAFADVMRETTHWSYYKGYELFLTWFDPFLSREDCSNLPHVKRALRQSYVKGVLLHDDSDTMCKRLNSSVKRELAKYGKVPRLFVDYNSGCMYANELPEYVKCGINGDLVTNFNGIDVVIHVMSKPMTDHLTTIFRQMQNSLGLVDFIQCAIYSDDAIMCGNINGVKFGINYDVSSNDSSQDAISFLTTFACLANFHFERAKGLIDQCTKPIICQNPENDSDKFGLKFSIPFEGSGSTLTTILNHNGNVANTLCATYLICKHKLEANSIVSNIHKGAYYAGHKVTTMVAGTIGDVVIEKLQFLKHSPMFGTDGLIHSTQNLGCYLRGFGTVRQDMTAQQCGLSKTGFTLLDDHKRWLRFGSAIVRGWTHEPSNPIIDAFRRVYNVECTDKQVEIVNRGSFHIVQPALKSSVCIEVESLCRRYDMDEVDIDNLIQDIEGFAPGVISATRAASKIYHVDYEFEMLDQAH
jgi:hypothetical protein